MHSLFENSPNYAALSLNDLLRAREEYHDDLMCKKNVVATAIGLYRIRRSDPWPRHKDDKDAHKSKGKRTLYNSEIRPYSWPCVYVFVSEWVDKSDFGNRPWDAIPKMLRMKEKPVPVCVIEAKRQEYSNDSPVNPGNPFPRNVFVPGSPILNQDAQGMPRLATAGCLVRDGERYYVLTNKHAVGAAGTQIYGFGRYQWKPVGVAAEKGITRKPFQEVYPHLASESQYVQMDIGLIEVNSVQDWQTKIPGLGLVENVLDLYDHNLTLGLLGMKVVGLGAASGFMRGEIQGLFYRYKSSGGYEYLSDFLIGPESDKDSAKLNRQDEQQNISFKVHRGDSGTLLLIEELISDTRQKITGKKYHPFALLWGKHEFLQGNGRQVQPYALATALSTTLNVLELDFVRDVNMDNEMVWGFIGHYAIGRKLPFSLNLITSASLKSFIKKNQDLLAMSDDEIRTVSDSPRPVPRLEDGTYDEAADQFVPLADVPDNVWKSNVNKYMVDDGSGKKKGHVGPGSRGQMDNPNHFSDADLKNSAGESLITLFEADKINNLTPSVWLQYYESVEALHEKWDNLFKPGSFNPKRHWGALPFRVWQIVDEMIRFAEVGNQESFFCAGGVLIHYVGDACQPLHSSYLSQGDPVHPKKHELTKGPREGESVWKLRGDGVHSGYEDDMVNANAGEIMDGLEDEIKRQSKKEVLQPITSGYDAAVAIMELIIATQNEIEPSAIVDKWVELENVKKSDRSGEMWDAFGKETIRVMARGCRYLANIWDGAWKKGGGNQTIGAGTKLAAADLQKLYESKDFLPSVALDKYKLKRDGKVVK